MRSKLHTMGFTLLTYDGTGNLLSQYGAHDWWWLHCWIISFTICTPISNAYIWTCLFLHWSYVFLHRRMPIHPGHVQKCFLCSHELYGFSYPGTWVDYYILELKLCIYLTRKNLRNLQYFSKPCGTDLKRNLQRSQFQRSTFNVDITTLSWSCPAHVIRDKRDPSWSFE